MTYFFSITNMFPPFLKPISDENFFSQKKSVCVRKFISSPKLFEMNKWQKHSSQKVGVCVRKIISSPNILILHEKTYFVTQLIETTRWQKKILKKKTFCMKKLVSSPNYLKWICDEIFSSPNISVSVRKVFFSLNILILREKTCFIT